MNMSMSMNMNMKSLIGVDVDMKCNSQRLPAIHYIEQSMMSRSVEKRMDLTILGMKLLMPSGKC